jgi:hypothetical protein
VALRFNRKVGENAVFRIYRETLSRFHCTLRSVELTRYYPSRLVTENAMPTTVAFLGDLLSFVPPKTLLILDEDFMILNGGETWIKTKLIYLCG